MILAAALLAAAAAPAFAATPIDETRPLAADGRVSIENLKGRIVVRAWDRPEVHIGGTLGDGVEKLAIGGSASSLSIEVEYPQSGWFFGRRDGGEPSMLELRVPAGASVSIDAVSADVDVSGMRGALLEVDAVSGDITLRDIAPRELRIDSVSGDVDARGDTRDLKIDTVSGDVTVSGNVRGRVAIDVVSGDVEVDAGTLDRLSFGSVSGDAELRLSLAPGGLVRADAVSGNITLSLPATTSARLAMETFSGRLTSPVGQVVKEEFGPGSHLNASLGDGDGDIRLESFSGNVRVDIR
ncbi:hypothetical protein P873_04890 [Arenimonas composti TR7-09 = DSM 18010]|uniref:DUF4097 domain-containing protein n=2 Tax=Arenimonas TaxID=490567 RepID=A0A091BE68_9GAMM|nr:hypothetical protein P873_04890 [Arenimonas composti TR7-09 = DSM 18010]